MIRVVIDTNVVVSANLVDEGPSAAILSLAINKKILMFVSAPVLDEYKKVLNRPRLKLDPVRIAGVLVDIRNAAAEASAGYLVTGNTSRSNSRISKSSPPGSF